MVGMSHDRPFIELKRRQTQLSETWTPHRFGLATSDILSKAHPPSSHPLHLLDDCLLFWVRNQLVLFYGKAKPSKASEELTFTFLNLLHLTDTSSYPLPFKRSKG